MEENNKKKKVSYNYAGIKNMSIIKLIFIDIVLFAVSMGVFLYFDYIRPQKLGDGTVVTDLSSNTQSQFSLPTSEEETTTSSEKETTTSSEEETTETATTSKKNSNSKGKNYGNTGTSDISSNSSEIAGTDFSELVTSAVDDYSDDNVKISVTKNELGSGSDKVTYYVADVYVTSVTDVLSAFAEDTYGKNIKDEVDSMAEENDAILAVNGDFYGNSEEGVVIRNGVLYRDDVNDADVCVIFKDGTMKTYSPDDFDADEVIAAGAWQAWTFGPALLDGNGNVLSSFNTTSYLNSENPRCAIGYVEEGHYKLVVVDGRDEGYSRGVTLTELAAVMANERCTTAYNLDGGKSAAMYFNGAYVNQPCGGGREVSDIVYIK